MSAYRYGFNGMEKDNEVKGKGNSYDFGARMYDSRVGRFLSKDPLEDENVSSSPYSISANSPIRLIDIGGESPGDPFTAVLKIFPMGVAFFNITDYHNLAKYGRGKYGGNPDNLTKEQYDGAGYNVKGTVGEALFAGSTTIGFLPFYRAVPIPHNTLSMNGNSSTYDVKVVLTPISSTIKRAKKGLEIRLGRSYIKLSAEDIGLQLYDANGKSTYKKKISETASTSLFVEVKTIGKHRSAYKNLVKGFEQAIKTAELKKGGISILATDKDSYLHIVKNPAKAAKIKILHSELKALGGGLLLKDNLNSNATEITREMGKAVGNTEKK